MEPLGGGNLGGGKRDKRETEPKPAPGVCGHGEQRGHPKCPPRSATEGPLAQELCHSPARCAGTAQGRVRNTYHNHNIIIIIFSLILKKLDSICIM